MAINGQQNIRIGLPNESVGSDSIRDAFTKVNTNFTNLFNNANPTIQGGNGIAVETSNTSVIIRSNLVAGNGIALANANGAIVITNTGGGGNGGGGNVSSVQVIGADSNARITSSGGPITSAGTISLDLANSNVTPGTYTTPTLTVDRFGRITAAANNNVAGTVTSVGLSPGTGIGIAGGPITAAGIITVTNTGVTRLTAGPGVTLTGNTGAIQISLAGGGGGGVSYVDIISNTLNSTGGPITSAGNINIELKPNTTITGTLTANGLVVNGTSNITGNVSIAGNLSVNGNITYINVENLNVQDPIIQLQTGPNGTPPVANTGKDVGTALNYYDTQARVAFMGWDVSNNEFGLASQATIASDIVTFSTYGNLRVGNILGNGQGLSGLVGANVAGQVANAIIAGTVYTAAQPNITSVGTLTSLNVAGNVSAGNVSGTLLTGTLATASQPNITSVGTLTNLTITGNVTAGNASLGNTANANYFVGNGFYLTGLNLSNVVASNANYAAFAGNITTASQPNITAVGTLTSLGVNGNITAANITANTGVFTGNGSGLSALAGANVTGQVGNATIAGTVYTAAQPNITSVGNLTSLTVLGNLTAANANLGNLVIGNFFQGDGGLLTNISAAAGSQILNGNSNISIAANSNVTVSVAGNANVFAITGTGVNVAGTLNATGNANVDNLSVSRLFATANITAPQIISNVAIGTAPLVVTSTTVVANLRAATSNVANTINDAAQPNITSVGTLTSLAVTGDFTSNNIVSNNVIRTKPVVFSALPAAATAGAGARAFITDGNLAASTNFAAQVQGGGSNNVPVYSDGTNWLIG